MYIYAVRASFLILAVTWIALLCDRAIPRDRLNYECYVHSACASVRFAAQLRRREKERFSRSLVGYLYMQNGRRTSDISITDTLQGFLSRTRVHCRIIITLATINQSRFFTFARNFMSRRMRDLESGRFSSRSTLDLVKHRSRILRYGKDAITLSARKFAVGSSIERVPLVELSQDPVYLKKEQRRR